MAVGCQFLIGRVSVCACSARSHDVALNLRKTTKSAKMRHCELRKNRLYCTRHQYCLHANKLCSEAAYYIINSAKTREHLGGCTNSSCSWHDLRSGSAINNDNYYYYSNVPS